MNLDEARSIACSDIGPGAAKFFHACHVFHENLDVVEVEELLELLRKAQPVRAASGVVAMSLYLKTKRPRPVSFIDSITDYQNWRDYVRALDGESQQEPPASR